MSTARTLSPCVRNCCLDEQDICLGCGRSLDEIVHWSQMSEEEHRAVLQRCQQRQRDRRQRFPGLPPQAD
ncbi:DUF1289 domain-containing protein [Balneatrix alpica]|uniref:DUF1289 domain-containing protein n=1 Tax=Balneatrix alpica TaxID=75684 RepID=A0ABV5ZDJ9_9GAMM|nr:DUF1289 domain-containing protein [Balneatrix alpica]